ncbi:hypothetical protein M3Y98_00982200 [Aphelenchoides besseyi]|nr:hypothetical protein M3Y98_00982200 [Aphelenchoides besseyi]KAI6194897.1 hypothetical protein M3Y96_01174100 [Aphelenchoides besseyi]
MGDAICEVHLNDNLYRLNTNARLKIVSRKSKPKQKVLRPVNQAIFKEFPDKRRGSPLPKDYVQYNGKEAETDEEEVEYDIDDEDLVWLELINERREDNGLEPISNKLLELGIDRFEKASYFQNTDASKAHVIDNDAVCCICEDGDDSNVNQIIFCDMCDIAVHQECYGVPYIPAGQWLCRRCQLSPSELVKCVFCPYTNGAFKQTSDNRWAHVKCALWLSEVHFANAVFMEPVEGVAFSLKRRSKLRCLVCKIKMGACLQCSKKSCVRPFHVTCAMYSGMQMQVETREKDGSDETVVNRYVFCHQHTAMNLKTMPSTQAAFKRDVQDKVKKARKILHESSRQSIQVAIPVISAKKLDEIRSELNIEQMEDILNYWSLKRRARCGVPLIRRLQVYHTRKQLGHRSVDSLPLNENANDGLLSIPGVEKEVANQLYRTGLLRNNLEKLRLLVELTKKREKYKLEMITNYRQIVETALKPTSEIMEKALEKLIEKDQHKVFLNPVSEAEVPGYRKIISKPMDFTKMRHRLDNGEYTRIADLRADFELMMDNCERFNANNKFYWRYGCQMRALGVKILRNAEQEEQSLTSNKLMHELVPILFSEQSEHPEIQMYMEKFASIKIAEEEPPIKKRKVSTISTSRRRSLAENTTNNNRFRDTKISDFFKPVSSSTPSNVLESPVLSPASKKRRTTAANTTTTSSVQSTNPIVPTFQRLFRQARNATNRMDYVTTEDSDSDEATTSADEDFGKRHRGNRRQPRRSAAQKTNTTDNQNRSGRPKSKAHCPSLKQPIASNDTQSQEAFAHDDIVWAPLKNEKFPARVFERSHIALESDRSVANQISALPIDNTLNRTLVVFFDTSKTIRYVSTSELEHCDVRTKLPAEQSTVNAALKRAKNFWDRYANSREDN